LKLVDSMLAEGGVAWFGDPFRQHAPKFVAAAIASGFTVDVRDDSRHPLRVPAAGRFQLIRLSRCGPAPRR
jgi:hypothetical protein